MLEFIKFLESLENSSQNEMKKAIREKLEEKEVSYLNFIEPGNIIDIQIGDNIHHGIVLANKVLLLIDPKDHSVKGYLSNYTDTVPYKFVKIRKPNKTNYKYTDLDIPIVWECEAPKTEMTIQDIEAALGLKSGTLKIK